MKTNFYTRWPPTVNNYYSKTRNGVYISKNGRVFRDSVLADIREQLGGLEITSERLKLEVYLYPPDKKIRDLDNYMKALLDAITASNRVWEDDSQIDQLLIYRGEIYRPSGYCYLEISKAEELVYPILSNK